MLMFWKTDNKVLTECIHRLSIVESKLQQLEIENKYLRDKILRRFRKDEVIGTPEIQQEMINTPIFNPFGRIK